MKTAFSRFSSGSGRRAAKAAACVAAVFAAALVFRSPTVLRGFDWLSARAHGLQRRILCERAGVVFAADLSLPFPVNEATGAPVVLRGVGFAPDAPARRFRGDRGELLRTDVRWTALAKGGTVAVRFRAEASEGERRLVWDSSGSAVVGLRLAGGRLEGTFADAAGRHVLSAPFAAEGRFATVAFVLSRERVSLWLDGEEVASGAVAAGGPGMPPHAIEFSGSPRAPAVADLAALAAWRRPLGPDEIRALPRELASARRTSPPLRAAVGAVDATLRFWRAAARSADRFVPDFSAPASMRTDIPVLELRLSKRDRRFFARGHADSLRAGFRTRAARKARTVRASFAGRSCKAELSLADFYAPPGRDARPGVDEPPLRPAFLLRSGSGGLRPDGPVRAVLAPPELWGALHPDARLAIPDEREALVRLVVDGEFRGVYVFESADRVGSAWLANGAFNKLRLDRVFSKSQPATAVPGANGRSEGEAARAAARVARILRSDPSFPWSGAEIKWRNRRHSVRRGEDLYPAPRLSALDFAGRNPSPLYVTSDLDLAPAGPGVAWRSSRPDVVSHDGRLLARPDAPEGTIVEMLAVFPDTAKRIFRFRVPPPRPVLPALFLHVYQPVERDWRTDFSAVRRGSGEAWASEEILSGTGDSGGGLHHRGNTSYVKGAKRPLSLEFDEAVSWSGAPDPVSHVLLLSGYADPTRLRNALSYHAFRALDPRNAARCVPVSWTEVYVNGEYYGVWEYSPRLVDVVAADAVSLLKVRSSDGLWARVSADMTEDAMHGRGVADPYGELEEAARFVVESTPGEFAKGWRDLFDGDNLADFWLILNFTGNEDGKITNQYIARRASDGRFVVCPWDYDKTFLEGHDRGTELSNSLLARVAAADPGFRAKCAARWAAARRGPLSDAALSDWIASRAAALAPAMGEEWKLLRPAGFAGDFAEAVEVLRRETLRRAAKLDAALGVD